MELGKGTVTAAAGLRILRGGRSAARNVVRIVTGGAGEPAGACQEAGRFPQTVRRAGKLEFVVEARARPMIEMQGVVLQGFSGAVGKHGPVKARDRRGQPQAGG